MKKMKTVDLFCASPASTAICSSMNQHAMVRRGATPKPLHRHRHYHNNHYQFEFDDDKPKFKIPIIIPCTSQHHIDPKPYNTFLNKNRKTTSTTTAAAVKSEAAMVVRRKSSADVNDVNTPRGSSRYLLRNEKFVDVLESEDVANDLALVVSEPSWPDYRDDSRVLKKSFSTRSSADDSPALVKSKSSNYAAESPVLKSSRSHPRDQVVELRVSIHCKGCEGKVRKHISRMEGVRSFDIDLERKKVTIVGDVTPLSVLSSISKVKTAQFWPSPSPSLSPTNMIPSSSSSSSPFIAIRY